MKYITQFLSLVLIYSLGLTQLVAQKEYSIIPQPVDQSLKGGYFNLPSTISISYDEALESEAKYLDSYLKKFGYSDVVLKKNTTSSTVRLSLDGSQTNEEGYKLDIGRRQVNISAMTSTGVFYGIQSFVQVLATDNDGRIPCGEVNDRPRFSYRGMHLDVARHFYDIDFVKKYLDMLALHKMNKFHWHLTEDQGWRIQIDKYPNLTQTGAYRNGTIVGHHPGTSNDNHKYGGFYTKEDIKEVLDYAKERHITVIPEIELPGHSQAAIASYPFLSCFPDERTEVPNELISEKSKEEQEDGVDKIVQESWGVYNDVYCAGNEKTFEFLKNVLDEVLELFPSTYIHIGGDECPKENWKRCSKCQARMKEEGLKDEHELQSYFVQRIEKYLNSKGRQIIGWDEILEGGLAPNATVMSWRGEKGGIEAAKEGHDVIMTPGTHCYFDHYQSQDTEEEPLAIGGFTTVEKVYSYNPTPDELTEDEKKYILGAQANVWTEYISSTDYIEYMALPRMSALAEVVWTPLENKNFNNFKERLDDFKSIYYQMDYNFAPHIFEK